MNRIAMFSVAKYVEVLNKFEINLITKRIRAKPIFPFGPRLATLSGCHQVQEKGMFNCDDYEIGTKQIFSSRELLIAQG